MFKLKNIILLVLTMTLLGCAGTSIKSSDADAKSASLDLAKYKKLAVIVHIDNRWYRADRSRQRIIESNVIGTLIRKGYTIPSRSQDLTRVRKELGLQHSTVTDIDAARLGKVLNVSAILVVHLSELGQRHTGSGRYRTKHINATVGGRLLDVETGQILWVGSKSGSANEKYTSTPDLLADIAKALATNL